MMREIVADLRTRFEAQGCPIALVNGPERAGSRQMATRVIIERQRGVDEVFQPAHPRTNPRVLRIWPMAIRVRVVARSSKAGATDDDHLDTAYELAKLVMCELSKEVQSRKQGLVNWSSARLPEPEELDLDDLRTWPGVVVDLFATVEVAVDETTWAQIAAGEAVLGTDFDVVLPATGDVDAQLYPGA